MPPRARKEAVNASPTVTKSKAANTSRSRKTTVDDADNEPKLTKPIKKSVSRGKRKVVEESEQEEPLQQQEVQVKPTKKSTRKGRQTTATSPVKETKSKTSVAQSKQVVVKPVKYRSRTPLRAESEESDEDAIGPTYSGKRDVLYSYKEGKLISSPRNQVKKSFPATPQSSSLTSIITPPPQSQLTSKSAMTIFAITFYFITSLATVFLNKYLLDSAEFKKSKIFITWVQIIFASLISYPISLLSSSSAQPQQTKDNKVDEFSIWPFFHTLPAAFIFSSMLLLNNFCLAYVHVAFYQVARSWTIVMSIILSFFFFGDKPSKGQAICCFIVVIGYILACDGEVPWSELYNQVKTVFSVMIISVKIYFNPTSISAADVLAVQDFSISPDSDTGKIFLGLVTGFFSCFMVAYHAIISKKLQQTTTITRSTLITTLNINSAIILFLYLVFSGELRTTLSNPAIYESSIYLPLLIVSFSGYLLGYATQMQIQYTSALGHNVSGTAKATVQSVLGWYYDPKTLSEITIFGTAVTILGCGVYSIVGGPPPKPQAQQPPQQRFDVNEPPSWIQSFVHQKTQ